MTNLFIFIIIALLIILFGLLAFYFFYLKKRLDIFFKDAKTKNLEEFLTSQLKKTKKQESDIKKIFEEISRLDEIAQKSFQKIGMIRYNPFKEVGSDQSFSIALLDAENNGFVITSLYSREEMRVYAKPIENGNSTYPLSDEEKEAIKKAMA